MNYEPNDDHASASDRAVADRLAKLRTMPVDTSRLDAALRSRLPAPPAAVKAGRSRRRIGWFRPLRAVAASFVLLSAVVAAVLLTTSSGPAVASASHMARMHEELVSGRTPVMQVGSIDEASRALNGQWPDGPGLPNAPEGHVMACCMRSVKDKKVACVLLQSEGVSITLTVAKAADMRLPKSDTVIRGGGTYHVQAVGDLNMVMTEREGRWICLIGRTPAERLIDIGIRLEY